MNVHAVTFDVEDWYQGFLSRGISGWQQYDSREIKNVEKILQILNEYNTKATFFVLGKFAEAEPSVVKLIDSAGHEIATHGYAHIPIPKQTRENFRNDLRRSIDVLEVITRKKVVGHRAASWSLTADCTWALEVIAEEGLLYDSSMFPTPLHKYGFSSAPACPFRVFLRPEWPLIEFPAQVLSIGPIRIPVAGGFYLRALPVWLSKWGLKQSERRGSSGLVYLHPYDFDPEVPRIRTPSAFRMIRYFHLDRTESYLKSLLEEFRFCSIHELLVEGKTDLPIHSFTNDR